VLRGLGAGAGGVAGSRRGELTGFGVSFDAVDGEGATDFDGADGEGSASALGLAGLVTIASVSETGVTAGLAADAGAGAGAAATGTG